MANEKADGEVSSQPAGGSAGLESGARHLGLADDRKQGADGYFAVVGYGHRDGRVAHTLLHHHVAATLTDERKSVRGKNDTNLLAG
jgi:hypothetical protein